MHPALLRLACCCGPDVPDCVTAGNAYQLAECGGNLLPAYVCSTRDHALWWQFDRATHNGDGTFTPQTAPAGTCIGTPAGATPLTPEEAVDMVYQGVGLADKHCRAVEGSVTISGVDQTIVGDYTFFDFRKYPHTVAPTGTRNFDASHNAQAGIASPSDTFTVVVDHGAEPVERGYYDYANYQGPSNPGPCEWTLSDVTPNPQSHAVTTTVRVRVEPLTLRRMRIGVNAFYNITRPGGGSAFTFFSCSHDVTLDDLCDGGPFVLANELGGTARTYGRRSCADDAWVLDDYYDNHDGATWLNQSIGTATVTLRYEQQDGLANPEGAGGLP